MPLFIDDSKESDRLWRQTQFWFKGKPSYSLDDVGPRNRNAFGPAPGLGTRDTQRNANDCHFLHKSASEGMTTFNGLWDMFPGDPRGGEETFQLCVFPNEKPVKEQTFSDKLNITYSVFADLEPNQSDNVADRFMWTECRFNRAQMDRTAGVISTGTFAGCWDCNHKMTQMTLIPMFYGHSFLYRQDIDELFYIITGTPTEKRDLLLNAQIYYLLMQAMLRKDNVIDGSTRQAHVEGGWQQIKVTPDQQGKWKFKLIILWCLLMILLSNWNVTTLRHTASHHTNYIFAGTSDFYVSLIMYTTYIANFEGRGAPLSFEEFHYFFMINFVFYLKSKRLLVDNTRTHNINNSLTTAIMNPAACITPQWGSMNLGLGMQQHADPNHFLRSAKQDMIVLYAGITRFSSAHLKPLCLHLYDPTLPDDQYGDYFPALTTVLRIRRDISTIPHTSIQAYADYLTPAMYWFHFKSITMPQISHAVKLARDMGTEEGKRVMDLWFKHASNNARHLHGPLPTSEGRALARLSAHFSAVLRTRGSSSCRS
jgi:hypothetical protein